MDFSLEEYRSNTAGVYFPDDWVVCFYAYWFPWFKRHCLFSISVELVVNHRTMTRVYQSVHLIVMLIFGVAVLFLYGVNAQNDDPKVLLNRMSLQIPLPSIYTVYFCKQFNMCLDILNLVCIKPCAMMEGGEYEC